VSVTLFVGYAFQKMILLLLTTLLLLK